LLALSTQLNSVHMKTKEFGCLIVYFSFINTSFLCSGRETTQRNGLTYNTQGFSYDYNENVDPSVLNDHATAAFRFFHTNIAGFLRWVKLFWHKCRSEISTDLAEHSDYTQ